MKNIQHNRNDSILMLKKRKTSGNNKTIEYFFTDIEIKYLIKENINSFSNSFYIPNRRVHKVLKCKFLTYINIFIKY